jgi:tetratricopeptide (TPR) repeat protein
MSTQDVFTDRLSEYLDNEDMRATDRAAIEAHLTACAECRATLAELRAVAAVAASLPDRPPTDDLWSGVANRLQADSLVVPFRRPEARRFSFTLPQLVAAGLALMVLSGGMVWVSRSGDPRASLPPVVAERMPGPPIEPAIEEPISPASFADAQFDQAIADLERALAENRGRLDPETVRILEENLQSIDQAIEQSRKALRADPANVYLNNHFAESRNRKLALLRRASALALAHDLSGS